MAEKEFMQELNKSEWKKNYEIALSEVQAYVNGLSERLWKEEGRQIICYHNNRIKTPESIIEKCKRKKCELSFEAATDRLNDIAGYRIVCMLQADAYQIKNLLVSETKWKLIKKKDFIRKPKKTGYRSLHLIFAIPVEKELVKVEIQIRTIVMDYWANFEYKLQYKTDKKKLLKKRDLVQNELKICSAQIVELEQHMQAVLEMVERTQDKIENNKESEIENKGRRGLKTTKEEKKNENN